jgi:hypothetical protein
MEGDNLRSLRDFKKEDPKFFWLVVMAVAVNAFFIWFPSFDHQNVAFWINSASYLQNAIPSFSGSPWPGGPFFLSIFVPIGLPYSFSGYAELASVAVLKTVLFAFTLLTAVLLYAIVSQRNRKFARVAFLFTLLNPGIIYVNYLWTELDIFPVFFVALSYYFIYYHEKRNDGFIYSLASFIPLFIAIFSFYYAVLIIPTIIIYSRSWRQRLNYIISALVLGVPLYIAETFLFRGGGYDLVGSLAPASNALYYQGLQRIILIPAPYLIASIGILSVLIPSILRRYGFSPSIPIFFTLMALLYTSTSAAANNFLWLYPFSFLSISENSRVVPRLRPILLTSSFFWTGIVFINLYIGTGIQAGIFYFAYNVFHANILFIRTNYQWVVSTLIYFAVLTASLAGTVIYILYFVRKDLGAWSVRETENKPPYGRLGPDAAKKRAIKITLAMFFIIVLLMMSIIFNGVIPTSMNDSSVREAPTEALLTQFPNGVVAFPVENITYFDKGNTINFYNNGNLIQMTRNLSSEFINISVLEKLSLQPQSNIVLVNTSDFQVSAYDSPFLNLSSYDAIAPNFTNAGNLLTIYVPSVSGSFQAANFNTNTGLVYDSEYFSPSSFYSILFKVQHAISPASSFNQTVLFGLYNGNTAVNFVVYNDSGILSYNNGNIHKHIAVYGNNNTPDGWNLLTLESTGDTLNVSINGLSVTLNGSFFGNNSKLYIGKQPGNDTSHSFTGWVSELYGSSAIGVTNRIFDGIISGKNKIIYANGGNEIGVNISDSQKGTLLTVQGHRILYGTPISYLMIGKLDPIQYGLSITFTSLHIMPRNNGGYYMIPVFFAFSVPYIVAALGMTEVYYSRFAKKHPVT